MPPIRAGVGPALRRTGHLNAPRQFARAAMPFAEPRHQWLPIGRICTHHARDRRTARARYRYVMSRVAGNSPPTSDSSPSSSFAFAVGYSLFVRSAPTERTSDERPRSPRQRPTNRAAIRRCLRRRTSRAETPCPVLSIGAADDAPAVTWIDCVLEHEGGDILVRNPAHAHAGEIDRPAFDAARRARAKPSLLDHDFSAKVEN